MGGTFGQGLQADTPGSENKISNIFGNTSGYGVINKYIDKDSNKY